MCVTSLFLCFCSNPPAPSNLNENTTLDKGRPYNPQQVQGRIREILGKYSNGFWVSKLPQIYKELYKQDLPTESIKDLETWTHICTVCAPSVTLVSYHVIVVINLFSYHYVHEKWWSNEIITTGHIKLTLVRHTPKSMLFFQDNVLPDWTHSCQ